MKRRKGKNAKGLSLRFYCFLQGIEEAVSIFEVGLDVVAFCPFVPRAEEENAVLEVGSAKRFAYQFKTTIQEGLLKQTHVGLVGSPYGLKWQYGNFKPWDKKQFPTTMFVAVEGARRSMTAQFNFSRLTTNEDWKANTQLSDRYEKMEFDDLLKILFK